MDQIKIGRFIADCRKQNKLTQTELADKLGITDKAVSKWERGIAMPDSSIMLEVCEILGVSVNELLRGEKIMENSSQKNQELLLEITKELQQKNKSVWMSMWVIIGVSLIALISGSLICAFFIPEGVWQLVGVLGVCIVFITPCFYALKLEISVGAYKCRHCGNEFVPTYFKALMAMHKGTTRHLKCPKCGKRSYCKKVIDK